MSFPRLRFCFLLILLLSSALSATTVILNSQDYQDILAAAVFARYYDYDYVFALTPNQSAFIARYYSAAKDNPIIYIEGARSVLPNMGALLQEEGLSNLTVVQPTTSSVQDWIADQMPHREAIVVGSTYGQDALAVSSYAALTGEPMFFVDDPSNAQGVLQDVSARGYSSVLLYGSIAHQLPQAQLSSLPSTRVIDTGNRYSNNVEIATEFLNLSPTRQVILVSGKTFEKSMIDKQFPLVLVGRSDVSSAVSDFVAREGIKTGVVYSGDADIVDGATRLRALNPGLSLFVKFGEGYVGASGSAQPLPLAIVPLPAPLISLEVLNLTYDVPAKSFELTVANRGDYAALTADVSVPSAGSAQSSLITMDPTTTTTLPISLDSTSTVTAGQIPQASLTLRYGEDINLTDNLDTITFTHVPTVAYNDTSDVTLTGVSYSDEQKAFLISLDGHGWASGTLSLSINNQPLSVRFPPTLVAGPTTVAVKYLLTGDEEKFINGLPATYFIRSGQSSDILIKEARGTSPISTTTSILGGSPGASAGLPVLPLCALAAVLVIAFLLYRRFSSNASGGGFD
ncbi:MAG: hypothetical protein KGH63_02295 [Candidatus Micrarchaeota archaeon]|nr:hypothetical protein [Candidatus Micrarchaeota archaeon]